jgi:hypothetical protein
VNNLSSQPIPRTFTIAITLVALAISPLASAQFFSPFYGFNDPPIDDPATSQEMFSIPEKLEPSSFHIFLNDGQTFNQNSAFRAASLQSEGAASLLVSFRWLDPVDPEAWVRLTTFEGAISPNPSLHTQGKVRFTLNNRSELFLGSFGLALGIRETGNDLPQGDNGGAVGPIEWVGVDATPNGITAGDDLIVDTTASGDDVQEVPLGTDLVVAGLPTGTAVISPGLNGTIDTTPQNDDALRSGYFIDSRGLRVPIPAMQLAPSASSYDIEFDLAAGTIRVNGGAAVGTIASYVNGNGVLDAANDRGTLEHLAIINDSTDIATLIEFGIDELQFEAPVPDPLFAPTVRYPIVAGDTGIVVEDLDTSVTKVTLLKNGNLLDEITAGLPASQVVFTIAPAVAGDIYTATQEAPGQAGTVVSAPSAPVEVLPEAPLFGFSLLIDEGGTGSCSTATGWEFVPATSASLNANTKYDIEGGAPLFVNDAEWQIVKIPLDDDSLVIAGPGVGGDGALLDSPNGFYNIDSLWFKAIDPNRVAPISPGDPNTAPVYTVLIDEIAAVDPLGDEVLLLDHEDGVNRYSGKRGQSDDGASTNLESGGSYAGISSHRFTWQYNGTDPEALGMLQRVAGDCGTAADIPDDASALRFRMVIRGEATNPNAPLPIVEGPIVVGTQDSVRILHDGAASSIALYINGSLIATDSSPNGTATDFTGLTLLPGDSVSATQTIPGLGVSDYAYPRGVADLAKPPTFDTLYPYATSVEVTGLRTTQYATASLVDVSVNGLFAGSAAGGSASVAVPLNVTLAPGDIVTATQTVNSVTSAEATGIVQDSVGVGTFEIVQNLADLNRSISSSDLLHMVIGTAESGIVDVANNVLSFDLVPDPNSGTCLVTGSQPGPGFHSATPGGQLGGLIDLTDGIPGSTVEAVLSDFNRASTVVRYDFPAPASIEELAVFCANEGGRDGRIYQHYDVYASSDYGATFTAVARTITSGPFGQNNTELDGATLTTVTNGAGGLLADDITNLRFVFYAVSNTQGRFQDPWHGTSAEDPGYTGTCSGFDEPEDLDGWRPAFEGSIIKEIDAAGYVSGDSDDDLDIDGIDFQALLPCVTGTDNSIGVSSCEIFDFNPRDDDVDMADVAKFQNRFTGSL